MLLHPFARRLAPRFAFPLWGVLSARKTVQWTVFSEERAAAPDGVSPQG